MTKGEYIPNFVEVTDSVLADGSSPRDVIITLGAGRCIQFSLAPDHR